MGSIFLDQDLQLDLDIDYRLVHNSRWCLLHGVPGTVTSVRNHPVYPTVLRCRITRLCDAA